MARVRYADSTFGGTCFACAKNCGDQQELPAATLYNSIQGVAECGKAEIHTANSAQEPPGERGLSNTSNMSNMSNMSNNPSSLSDMWVVAPRATCITSLPLAQFLWPWPWTSTASTLPCLYDHQRYPSGTRAHAGLVLPHDHRCAPCGLHSKSGSEKMEAMQSQHVTTPRESFAPALVSTPQLRPC